MNEQNFPAGTVIFRPGDPGACAFLIREGTVELLRGADASSQVALLGTGDVFGEMSLIEERPHTLTARAKTAVKAHALPRDQFERLLTTDPTMLRAYLKTLFERLRVLSGRFEAASEPAGAVKTITVTIHPLTRRAAETLPDNGLVVPSFPFRIGRAAESREHDPLDLNEMWLLDKEPFHVSRNHALISVHDGAVQLVDRGSKRGSHVNDVHIGARSGRPHAILEDGDNVVILGGLSSPYQFRVHVAHS